MKKTLAVLSMLACMFGLCACGSEKIIADPFMTVEEAQYQGENDAAVIATIVMNGQEYIDQYAENAVIYNGLLSYQNALEETGTCTVVSSTAQVSEEEAIVDVTLSGTSHDAVMEIIYNADGYASISTTVTYSFSEMMGKAGLNTLIGMGTVFVVLILISLIISLFQLIPKMQEALANKDKAAKNLKSEAVDNTIAQIIEKEELSDDLELVAVIAAAVAASEGAASTDGYVVRSIRRRA